MLLIYSSVLAEESCQLLLVHVSLENERKNNKGTLKRQCNYTESTVGSGKNQDDFAISCGTWNRSPSSFLCQWKKKCEDTF